MAIVNFIFWFFLVFVIVAILISSLVAYANNDNKLESNFARNITALTSKAIIILAMVSIVKIINFIIGVI